MPKQVQEQSQPIRNRQKTDQLIKRIYTEYYDSPVKNSQTPTSTSKDIAMDNSKMVNMMYNPLAHSLNNNLPERKSEQNLRFDY